MGHGKMAAVALATEWRTGGESERLSFFGGDVQVIGRYREYVKRAAGTHKEPVSGSVSPQPHSGHQHLKLKLMLIIGIPFCVVDLPLLGI